MRLIEIINREPHESERQVVVIVDGKPLVIDAGRSINLTVEKAQDITISDEMPGVFEPIAFDPLPSQDYVDDHPPTDDETTHDPVAVQAELAETNDQIAALDAQIAELTAEEPAPDYTKPMLDAPVEVITREALEALPFLQLREIANGLGIKGRAKDELVREILAAQEPK